MGHDRVTVLRSDYRRIALAGLKRTPGPADEPELRASARRLAAAGLAVLEDGALVLQRPEYATIDLDPQSPALYAAWLRADEAPEEDEVLYEDLGYWHHWWNMLHETGAPATLHVEAIAGSSFVERPWLAELDRELIARLAEQRLLSGRVIVPPSTLEAPAEGLVEQAIRMGLEIRVLPVELRYTVYNQTAAVHLDGLDEDGRQRHRLTRRASIVQALRELFELHWTSAIPWRAHVHGATEVLELLAEGWDDERIAATLGISGRTVSRRVAEAMHSSGARSRFELGMRYALSRREEARP